MPDVHGGPDAQGRAVHDFSTNANACGPCPSALAAVQAADASRYPDPAYTALKERLAAFHGVVRERIVVAGSASEFIVRMTAAFAGRTHGAVMVPPFSYGDYAQAARAHGLVVRRPHDASAGAPLRAVWACEPSSPLGQAEAGLGARLDALPPGVPLVLDRAYEPLRLQGEPALDAAQLDRVWQLWSPNKALGLTGVRGGYAIAPLDDADGLARQLNRRAPSWPLGAHAVAMLDAWTAEATRQWLADCLPTLRAWKTQQQALCRALGWQVLPSDANFFCARPLAPLDFHAMLAHLRAAGIKLRDTASFGLAGHVRLGVLPPDSQHALAQAWRAFAGPANPVVEP
ncbi:MAG: aminotransferase class I/II-fold pyridoxal phosphate-dependent enzyme [Variovorax sp.]|nr:MAG: aminotransferase class I/II-fold pyridoxal phosphate-dependent enzyme [Variovorax sp.]